MNILRCVEEMVIDLYQTNKSFHSLDFHIFFQMEYLFDINDTVIPPYPCNLIIVIE